MDLRQDLKALFERAHTEVDNALKAEHAQLISAVEEAIPEIAAQAKAWQPEAEETVAKVLTALKGIVYRAIGAELSTTGPDAPPEVAHE